MASTSTECPTRRKKKGTARRNGVKLAVLLKIGEIEKVGDLKAYVANCGKEIRIDARCIRDDKTPLMIACEKLQPDNVKFLLALGANPNATCIFQHTPMYYACSRETPIHRFCELEEIHKSKKAIGELEARIQIIQLLLEHGGTLEHSDLTGEDTLSPPCIAAVNGMKDVVQFFEAVHNNVEQLPHIDLVKAYQLLGVSFSILGSQEYEADYAAEAQACFDKGDELYREIHRKPPPDAKTKFEECFHMEEGDYEGSDGTKHQRYDKNTNLRVKGMIIGEQFLPNEVKDSHLWEEVFVFALDELFEHGRVQTGFKILQYAIDLEKRNAIKPGKTLSALTNHILEAGTDISSEVMELVCQLVDMYSNFSKHPAYYSWYSMSIPDTLSSLADMLVEVACFNKEARHVDLLLQTVKKIVQVGRRRIKQTKFSVTLKTLEAVTVIFILDWGTGETRSEEARLIRVLSELLACDQCVSAKSTAHNSGTMLHILMTISFVAVHIPHFVIMVLKLLVRYGCPIDAKNASGSTAKDTLVHVWSRHGLDVKMPAEYAELMQLLSPPSSPLSLEEQAARCILRKRIAFKERLPPTICALIDGQRVISDISELDLPELEDDKASAR